MSKMFRSVTRTFNPVTGCKHGCDYCWARRMAEGRLKTSPRYQGGFHIARFHEDELKEKFKPTEFVFVCSMGDLFGRWVPFEWQDKIILHTMGFPDTHFLFLTKNPMGFHDHVFGANALIGITLETTENYHLTSAPSPIVRLDDFHNYAPPASRFLSIEPVMKMDIDRMLKWVSFIRPELIEVGADNYGYNLPEPTADELTELIKGLKTLCPSVMEKDSLGRIYHGGK